MIKGVSIWTAAGACILLAACAQMRGLDGGQQDKVAPVLVSAFPANLSTRYTGETIVFTFDEYIQVNNLAQELIISPPLRTVPKVVVRKRSVIVELEEELLPNTTYTFNFGKAVADIHESNSADLIYVVSTGPVLDSLSVHGNAIEMWSGSVPESGKVMLFPDTATQGVFKERPRYFARIRPDGTFNLNYLPEGQFFLVAVDDENNNYTAEPEEMIAYVKDPVVPALDDSSSTAYRLRLSKDLPVKPTTGSYEVDSAGYMVMQFDRRLGQPDFRSLQKGITPVAEFAEGADSIQIWLGPESSDLEVDVEVSWNGQVLDTLQIPHFQESHNRAPRVTRSGASKIAPGQPLRFRSSSPVPVRQANLVQLLRDSLVLDARLIPDPLIPNRFELETGPISPGDYNVEILPGCLGYVDGTTNDTIRTSFTVLSKEQMGELIIQRGGYAAEGKQILQLLNSRSEIKWQGEVQGTEQTRIPNLEPGDYVLRIWEDRIENGRWDQVNYAGGQQPEEVWIYPGKISVRANWELRLDWTLPAP